MPWARGADGVEGLGARLRSVLDNSCVLTGWNGRSVNCSGLLRGSSVHAAFRVGKVVASFANFLANALACEGWDRGNTRKAAAGLPQPFWCAMLIKATAYQGIAMASPANASGFFRMHSS